MLFRLVLHFVTKLQPVRRSFASSKAKSLIELLTTMPKVPNTGELRNHRRTKLEENARWKQSVPPTIYLQVLGNGTHGSPKAVHLFTTYQRYLFNCGEGTQRFAHEHKVKLAKLEHVFITYKSWDNIGGLPGLALTIQDIGVPTIGLHGPPGVENIFNMTSSFLLTKDINIEKRHFDNPPLVDGALQIEYVTLLGKELDSTKKASESDNTTTAKFYDQAESIDHHIPKRSPVKSPPPNKRARLETVSKLTRDVCLAYICKPHSKKGMLLLDKCVDFGVPVGPLLGDLKNGKDVTLPNGKTVYAKDVVSPDEPGPVFIIVDCPSINFLNSLLENKQFVRHQASAKSDEDLAEVVVHFTPSSVMKHEKYIEWLHRFSPSTHHLLVNDSCAGCSSVAVHRIQHKLHLLSPEVFPLLKSEDEYTCAQNTVQDTVPLMTRAEPLMQYHLRPRKKSDKSCLLTLDIEGYRKEVTGSETCTAALEEFGTKLSTLTPTLIRSSGTNCPEVIFFGTGSSIPSKVRNVSSILVHLSETKSMFLDCGEGTYAQLIRFYGHEETETILKKVEAIFVSHLHPDHHMGLIQLLIERRKAFEGSGCIPTPLYLVAPHQIRYWLSSYHSEFEPILDDFRLVSNDSVQDSSRSLEDEVYNKVLSQIGLKDLSTVKVIHCRHSFGVIFTHLDDWKLVYSGDTMPCEALVKAGKNCDILIHEATMEDDLVEEARIKMHSTTSEAIEIGQKMDAKFTILTHFSQRYAKVPIFTDDFSNNVAVAFDNMKLSLATLPLTPHFIPALKAIFSEDYEEMQEQRDKKLRRKERTLISPKTVKQL